MPRAGFCAIAGRPATIRGSTPATANPRRTRTARTANRPAAIASWVFYDFANSAFTTLVVTFVYATYFTQAIAADPIRGTALWSRAITLSAIAVAVLSPVLGAIADRGGYRKVLLVAFTWVCIVATAALHFVPPGHVLAALVVFIAANVAFELADVFYNAFLPDIAPQARIGSVSGMGWACGYVGGLLSLVAALVMLVQPATPWFGFSTEAGENIRATNLLVAVWFAAGSLPLFLLVGEPRSAVSEPGRVVRDALAQLRRTLGEMRKYRQIARFLLARLIYNDALVTIFAFGGIYAAETFDFTLSEVLVFGIVVNVAAGAGAFTLGYLDDYIGGKRTIVVSLIGLVLATALAVVATTKDLFWAAGIAIGLFVGPNQSASRSLMGRFVPPRKENELFGFFAFSGKLTAFVGPLLLGVLTEATGSQRAGVAAVLAMFIVSLPLLLWVDEREGIAAAARA